jgi:heat shock 70kDa protein 4
MKDYYNICAFISCILTITLDRNFQVNDGFPFSIALSWNGDSQNTPQQTLVFPKGNAIPSTKVLTFFKSSTFEVDVLYVDPNGLQIPQKISTYTVSKILTMVMLFNSCPVCINIAVLI